MKIPLESTAKHSGGSELGVSVDLPGIQASGKRSTISLPFSLFCLGSVLAQGFDPEPLDFDPLVVLESLGVQFGHELEASPCASACNAIYETYGPGQVARAEEVSRSSWFFQPWLSQTPASYESWLSQYWSLQQSQTLPTCIFRPSEPKEVSVAVLLARATQCEFAVKSGGHAPSAGASNRQNGLTIDLAALDQIKLSEDGKIASIGPGNRWANVYETLQPRNLTVVGGRLATVGVGGLVLGGGISYFSNLHGWACDNVANYEVVTAAGRVINANESANADLYWALRGGGNNFGIVTRFDMYTRAQGPMWGGSHFFPIQVNASINKALVDFGVAGVEKDRNAALFVSYAYDGGNKVWIAVNSLVHALAQEPGQHPAVYDDFFEIPALIHDDTGTKTHAALAHELAAQSPDRLRQSFWSVSFLLDERIVAALLQIWREEMEPLTQLGFQAFVPSLTFQVISLAQMKQMSRAGGNILGLADETKPLLLALWSLSWDDREHDDAVQAANARILTKAKAAGEALGLNHNFLYRNYVDLEQNPFNGFSDETKNRLLAISKKYDPTGVFQTLQPGYLKLEPKS